MSAIIALFSGLGPLLKPLLIIAAIFTLLALLVVGIAIEYPGIPGLGQTNFIGMFWDWFTSSLGEFFSGM